MKQLTNSEIISKLPAYIVEEAKMHLRFGVPSHVIRRNGDDNKKERQTVKIASAF